MEAASREYRKVWISKTVLGILAIGTVVLRMHVRVNKKKQRVGWDDFFSVLSLLFMIADFVCNILEMNPRLRSIPQDQLTIKDTNYLNLLSYLTFWWVDGCEVAARFSMIFLYHRLFSVQRWMFWGLRIIGLLTILWFVALIFLVSFQCTPAGYLFDVSIGGSCHVNNLLGFSISEVVNALLDLALVFLPVRSVMKLQLPMKEKIGVAAIFVIGAFIVITSMLRIIFGFTPDATNILGLQRLSFWTGIHLAFVVISTCLPLFRSLLPGRDGIFFKNARHVYQSVSRWRLLSTRNSNGTGTGPDAIASGADYPTTYIKMNDKNKSSTPSVDQVPLTQVSMMSDVERLGRCEYHRQD